MKKQSGFSLIELLIVVVIIGVIAAIAVPNLLASRRSANGASAIETLRLIHSVETTYQAGVGNGNYGDATDLFNHDLIDPVVASAYGVSSGTTSIGGQVVANRAPKAGYFFGGPNGGGPSQPILATPASPGVLSTFISMALTAGQIGIARTGDRNFYIDETGVLRATITATDRPDISSTPLNN